MKEIDLFWDNFHQKKFAEAEQAFERMDAKAKQEIFAALFQQGQNHRKPHSVSVLFRKLHEDKKFDDFYQAWFPSETKCNKQTVGGETYQQFFSAPIRVIHAVNINDPKDIVSIGLHWITDEELEFAMRDPKVAKDGAERGDKISTVADKEQTGVYKVLKDDNLGTAF